MFTATNPEVYPEEALQRVPKELLSHAKMTTYSYQVPQSELELRQAIRDPKRNTGMKTKAQEEQFGLPLHTQTMLTDTHLHTTLQVCCPISDLCNNALVPRNSTSCCESFGMHVGC